MPALPVSTAALLAEGRHLMPRCGMRERLRLAPSDSTGGPAQTWRPVTDAELRQMTDLDGAASDLPAFTLFSIPPQLRRRLAAVWQGRDAADSAAGADQGLVADLVDFFTFIDAPIQGLCSVQMDLIDEQGMDAGPIMVTVDASHVARINLGRAEVVLVIGPVDLPPAQATLVRVALGPDEGVFVHSRAPTARLITGSGDAALVVSVLPEG